MSTANFKTGYNFNRLNESIRRDKTSVLCLEGGGRSGKTRDICSFLVTLAVLGTEYIDISTGQEHPIKSVFVVGETLASLKLRAIKDFTDHLKDYDCYEVSSHRKSDPISYTIRDTTFFFMGADDPEKFKGPTCDIAWINEPVPFFNKTAFEYIKQRAGWFVVMDWNPVLPDGAHWCYDVADRAESILIKSTILTNPLAPAGSKHTILGYEPTPENIQNGTANERLWKIFGLGVRAVFEGLVYQTNWHPISERPAPNELQLVGYGLDFGYSNDQTAMVAIYKYRTKLKGVRPAIFIKTILYEVGLFNSDIASRLAENSEFIKSRYVVCDIAPKDIDELRVKHKLNTIPARKGAGSRLAGVAKCNDFDLYCLKSDPINTERNTYSYIKKRGEDGKYTNEPSDGKDHALDAMRYGITTLL